ncbi:MAG: potassium-transporting ATPase subunit A [Rubrobacteridae bacterium]|nr:potassium-transporting ATPase subunit A [Rubrobacteridae bacterium]
MLGSDMLQLILYFVVLLLLAFPLGLFMSKVFNRDRTFLDPIMRPLESLIYKFGRIDPTKEMGWKEYAFAVLIFNILGFAAVFFIELAQGALPLNPQRFDGVDPYIAFNTAVSFMTNTNWQAYGGETTMRYLTQMLALPVQNFLSAATGIAVVVALIRGLTRKTTQSIGNFWVDLVRSTLWVLVPLSFVFAVFLVSQGVIQNFNAYESVTTMEGAKQTIAMGPVASQEAVKMLGTNGGGFMNANSAHPFENPTPLSDFFELLSILLIPAALTFTFGRMVGNARQGYVVLGAMLLLFMVGLSITYMSEHAGNPLITKMGVSEPAAMEGKEVRFGIVNSALWATATTAASMFIVGLMVGRTPEYLGKKIESWEMKMAVLAVLIPSLAILVGTAIAVLIKPGTSSILNPGPHGFSEILYAFTSAAGNNGSAFGGLTVSTPFYTIVLGLAMLIGRFGVLLPVLAIAGSLASKKTVPAGPGTFQTDSLLFTGLLAGVVLIVGALTFFPALALGPIVEQLLMNAGKMF